MRVPLFALLLALSLSTPAALEAAKVRVTADDVNVRANSNTTSKVMCQVSSDTILEAVSSNSVWTAILPPPGTFVWLHADLLSEGKVRVKQANLRAGPGINYTIMGNIRRGTSVAPVDQFSNWVKLLPPEGTIVWISSDYVAPMSDRAIIASTPPRPPASGNTSAVGIAAKPPKPMALTGTDDAPASDPDATAPSLSSAGITSNMLVKTESQGAQVSRKGVLKKASLVWRRPSRYMLVRKANGDNDSPICYVTGNEPQLESVLGKTMTVTGKQFIVQGAKVPVLSAKRIVLH